MRGRKRCRNGCDLRKMARRERGDRACRHRFENLVSVHGIPLQLYDLLPIAERLLYTNHSRQVLCMIAPPEAS